ncbi:BREX protein BrxB domain-containing protein [Sorangium sp. So ce1014]|uniref:BREX protein BrxB domain-containing protein n=1 Tax=Sorangium sp. So ce1014 TaxID=3133326 RepID=UPI003F62B21A
MSGYQHPTELGRAVDALREDLLGDDGPQISTVRNYNFAILPYDPEDEFKLRRAIHELSETLRDAGWNTGTIPLNALLLARLRAQGSDFLESMIQREKRLATSSEPGRGLRTLKERVVTLLEGPEGIAKDVIREIDRLLDERSSNPDRTVIFLGRAGSLYPFFRTSALLKHVAGHTRNVPVVLLYPGNVVGETGLSFMGVLPADRDYRPRIYR